eukprot:TRINITY_DN6126_c0_g1_i3.p1 TRINITY_DN6126_c0_g1~~TRINITY_DN6126_c0_g1_i3.p1  ORF type:complete len:227 (+),score=35.12 TRINITY_DN6126_c0_g1_i3:2-682(+)
MADVETALNDQEAEELDTILKGSNQADAEDSKPKPKTKPAPKLGSTIVTTKSFDEHEERRRLQERRQREREEAAQRRRPRDDRYTSDRRLSGRDAPKRSIMDRLSYADDDSRRPGYRANRNREDRPVRGRDWERRDSRRRDDELNRDDENRRRDRSPVQRDPESVPRRGYFYEHDNRRGGGGRGGYGRRDDYGSRRREADMVWSHDKFDEINKDEEDAQPEEAAEE